MSKEICPGCGSTVNEILSANPSYTLKRCKECSLVYKIVVDAGEELSLKINELMFSDAAKRSSVLANKKMAEDRVKILTKYINKGDLLEIGCATGEFLESANKNGFKAFGIDMSKNYVEYARNKGLDALCTTIETIENKSQKYDIVVMFHLIEHIAAPNDFLKKVNNVLKKGGLLYIITPNINSSTNKLFGYKHSVYHHPDHYIFYSEKTLASVLNRSGFEVVQKLSNEYHHHLFTSLKGFIAGSIRGQNKTSTPVEVSKNEKSSGSVKKYLSAMLNLFRVVSSPLQIPYSYYVSKKMKGHELVILAKKIE